MKNLIQAAVVTLFAASTAQAQQAVQWKLSDGGNGHWYRFVIEAGTFWDKQHQAVTRGGHLVTLQSQAENDLIAAMVTAESWQTACWVTLGGYQEPGAVEPAGGWRWVTDEPFSFTHWHANEPNNQGAENFLEYWRFDCGFSWNDGGNPPATEASPYVIEWDGDCNQDGLVDYGQCHDGTLVDYNGNNVLDCCERGDACVVGNYPVQWRIEDGGNGHWYQARRVSGIRWPDAKSSALSAGGHLASISSLAEDSFLKTLAIDSVYWIGGSRVAGANCSAALGWSWVNDEPFGYAGWAQSQPDCWAQGQLFLAVNNIAYFPGWHDYDDAQMQCFVIEWDADCNNDGVVDEGQILTGTLTDANSNGLPDICEQPTCHDADLYRNNRIDGADLGILLSEWGPVTPSTNSDINKDGSVNGADLGLLLSFWGPCP